jgi:hypothetical protein
MMRAWRVTVILMLAGPPANAATDAVSVLASPPLSPAPGLVRLVVRIERNASNRNLIVEVNSLALFRSSLIALEGESAPTAYLLEYDSLPAGLYTVTVTLHRDDADTTTAKDMFTVVP